jgi:hypothetical protein
MRILRQFWFLSFFLLVGLALFGAWPASAQELAPATITKFEITTVDGKAVKEAPLMSGGTYKINFTIQVAAGLKENCILKTSLERASGMDRFWTLKGTYPGIDSESWQPGQPNITFQALEGTADLELVGTVPADYLSKDLADGQTLNMSKQIPIIELALESGTVVFARQIEVVNNSIEEYRDALNAKTLLLERTESDPAYSNLIQALIDRAEAEAKLGYTDLAMNTLNAIPDSGWVKPQGQSSTLYLWIIAGILAIIAVISSFLLMQTRGKLSYFRRQSDNQAKNLKILAKKASRIGDPSLTAGIEQLQKELDESTGGI